MKLLGIILSVVFFISAVFAQAPLTKRVVILKSTGRLLEMQSAKSKEGSLIANAMSSGRKKEELEEKLVTEAEYAKIRALKAEMDKAEEVPPPPTVADKLKLLEAEVAALKAKIGQ